MKRSSAMLWLALGLLLAGLVGVAVYKTWPVLFPEVVAVAALNPNCDLRAGACRGVLPSGGMVDFSIEPDTIPVLKTLRLTVGVEGLEVQAVDVDFAGTDMNMGYNRVALQPDASGLWLGQGMLPVCVRDVMGWEATVLLRTADGLMAAPFRFVTHRN